MSQNNINKKLPYLKQTARSTASFIDSIGTSGVNKKYDWDKITDIADDIGIEHFRNLTKHKNGVDRLAGNNYTYTVSVGVNIRALDPSPEAVKQLLTAIKSKHDRYRDRLIALEGPNEYDYIDPDKDPDWATTLTAFVKELYQQMRADPWFDGIPYVGPSFYRDYNMQKLLDISEYIDAGNLHLYTNPPVDGYRFNAKYSGYLSANLPLYITEIGNNTKSTSEEIEQGRLYPRIYLVNFNRGVLRSHNHVLIDSNSNSSNGQKRYGIVRSDFTYKPAAIAIKNTIALLQDEEKNSNDFRFLNFSIVTDGKDIQHTLLYHSSKDKYYLALWRGIFNNNASDAKSIPVTIDFQNNISRVEAYKPNLNLVSTKVAIDNNSITVAIDDRVTFLEITSQGNTTDTPDTPTELTATNLGPSGVKLAWKDNSANEEGFGIERDDGLFGWRLVGTVEANLTNFVDRIQPNRDYRYRIVAVNSSGRSEYTNTVAYRSLQAKITIDPLANFDLIDSRSPNWEIENPPKNPIRYDYDRNLAKRQTNSPEYLIYRQQGLRDFNAIVYMRSRPNFNLDRTSACYGYDYPSTDTRYYSSIDGINWQNVTVNYDRVITVKGKNTDVIFTTPKDILPADTQYLKIEFTGACNSRYLLGRVKLISALN